MKHRYIGKSGLRVSEICLGTMTFGTQCKSEDEALKILDYAYEKGVNFFDTAELYPVPPQKELCGITEQIVGKWLKTKPRDSIILATKVAGAANGWFVPPIRHGLTAIDRFHIKKAIEGSLKRLQTDYIDLYQIHWSDKLVPIEEPLEVFHELIKEGKIRYIGTSNDTSYNTTKALYTSKMKNYKRFESIQNNFSMLNRRFLDDLAKVCLNEKISLLPYSPNAGGVLSGKYNGNFIPEDARFSSYIKNPNERIRIMAQRFLNEKTLKSTEKYIEIAKELNISPTTLAIAWTLSFDFVASSIIGVTRVSQLDDNLKASQIRLSDEVLQKCKAVHDEILYPMG
ncbi:MAG: aldo/keto reductase [Campylobacterales bacterium]|nr:aldo/keto reductase [Campylobacterales bacterium]